MTKNAVQHGRTKHIDVRYHFIRDHCEKGDIALDYVSTEFQLADIFIKPLDGKRFEFIRRELNMINVE